MIAGAVGLENVFDADSGFGGGEKAFVAFIGFSSAAGTFVDVVVCVDVAEAEFGFNVPVVTEYPAVAVGQACACSPSLIAVIAQGSEVESCEIAGKAHMSEVELSGQGMHGEEVSGRGIAKPESCFGLYHPVFPTAAVAP